jgi:hypothetical protein
MIYSSLNLFWNGQQPVVSIYFTTVTNPPHPITQHWLYTKKATRERTPQKFKKTNGYECVCVYNMLRLHNYSTVILYVKSFEMEQRYSISLSILWEKKTTTLPMTFLSIFSHWQLGIDYVQRKVSSYIDSITTSLRVTFPPWNALM